MQMHSSSELSLKQHFQNVRQLTSQKPSRDSLPATDRAEGLCCGLPYDTQLASSAGCSIHFWCGEAFDDALLEQALKKARSNRDIIYASASLGQPINFWANQDIN
jgi:hypothetical protein